MSNETTKQDAFDAMLKALKNAVALADANCPRTDDGGWCRTEKAQASYNRCVEAIVMAERWADE